MALREDAALVTLSLPSAYSFWASMMMRVLLLGVAEEGETPTIWRKDWTAIVGDTRGFVGCVRDAGFGRMYLQRLQGYITKTK